MLVGLLLAFATAVLDSAGDIYFSSKAIKTLPHLVKVFSYFAVGVPTFGIMLLFTGIPDVDPWFWPLACTQSILICIALWLFMRALANGSIAQTKPILGLTPVLMIITNPLMTNDTVSLLGWIGVFLVTFGVYGTQLPNNPDSDSFLKRYTSPFRNLNQHEGVRCALWTSVIFSITANIDKICLSMSTPVFYLFVISALSSILLYAAMHFGMRDQGHLPHVLPRLLKPAIGGGAIQCSVVLIQMHALLMIPVPYVVSIKRLSILISSMWAYYVRKDRAPSSERLLGALLVVLGIALIALAGT